MRAGYPRKASCREKVRGAAYENGYKEPKGDVDTPCEALTEEG